MNKTSIEWTDYTAGLIKSTHAGGPVSFDEWEARRILRTRTTGKRILMKGDPFEEDVPDEMLDRMFAVFALRPDLTFQLLTKRPERMRAYLNDMGAHYGGEIDGEYMERWGDAAVALTGDPCAAGGPIEDCGWPLPNVWLGVSVEDQAAADERIPALLDTPAAVRSLSCEPLLEPVDLEPWLRRVATSGPGWRMTGGSAMAIADIVLDWVIVGGESGPEARPCGLAWIRGIVAQCKAAGVPVFVKQAGSKPVRIHAVEFERSDCPAPTVERVSFGATGTRSKVTEDWAGPWDRTTAHGQCLHPMHLRDRAGRDMSEWPEDLRVREYPR